MILNTLGCPHLFSFCLKSNFLWNNLVHDGKVILVRMLLRSWSEGIPWECRGELFMFCWISSTQSTSLWPETFSETFVSHGLLLVMTSWSSLWDSEWTQWRGVSTASLSIPTHSPWFVYTLVITVIWLSSYIPRQLFMLQRLWRERERNRVYSVLSAVRTIILQPPLETTAEAWDALLSVAGGWCLDGKISSNFANIHLSPI